MYNIGVPQTSNCVYLPRRKREFVKVRLSYTCRRTKRRSFLKVVIHHQMADQFHLTLKTVHFLSPNFTPFSTSLIPRLLGEEVRRRKEPGIHCLCMHYFIPTFRVDLSRTHFRKTTIQLLLAFFANIVGKTILTMSVLYTFWAKKPIERFLGIES